MKELLNEIDELLTHLENYVHGKDGNDITEMRYKIRQALLQPEKDSTIELSEKEKEQVAKNFKDVFGGNARE